MVDLGTGTAQSLLAAQDEVVYIPNIGRRSLDVLLSPESKEIRNILLRKTYNLVFVYSCVKIWPLSPGQTIDSEGKLTKVGQSGFQYSLASAWDGSLAMC